MHNFLTHPSYMPSPLLSHYFATLTKHAERFKSWTSLHTLFQEKSQSIIISWLLALKSVNTWQGYCL